MKKLVTVVLVILLCCSIVTPAFAAGLTVKTNERNTGLALGSANIYQLFGTANSMDITNEKFTFSTSNKKVAVVSPEGNITAIGCGACEVTAKTSAGEIATYTINVLNNNDIADAFTVVINDIYGHTTSFGCFQTKYGAGAVAIHNENGTKAYYTQNISVGSGSTYSIKVGVDMDDQFGINVDLHTKDDTGREQNNGEIFFDICDALIGLCR